LWTIKGRIKSIDTVYSWWGLPVMIICLLVPLAKIDSFQIQFIAFIGFSSGLIITLLGRAMFKMLAFPVLFLITMTPLPQDWYDNIANISRTIAFGGSLKIISLLGIPYFRVGWDIELPNALLRVAMSCSGIRYLISYVVFGLAYAYLFRVSNAGRIVTVLATLPISIFASISRLTIIFVMTYYVSPFWSQHKPHVILSWFIFGTFLFSSIFIDQWVQARVEKRKAQRV
jgi:exosortase